MSKPSNFGPSFDTNDTLSGILDVAAKICFYGGLLCLFGSVGFLLFTYFHFSGQVTNPKQAQENIDLLSKFLVVGSFAAAIGSTYLYWGEELLHAGQLIIAGLLFFAPMYLPMVGGTSNPNDVQGAAIAEVAKAGAILGVIGIIALAIELLLRVRVRIMQGVRSDTLKFGKGIKEERYQNKFMGKCWQLPFCRKFVRERCPIYHAKRTCWKERVGCMCEEEVIRNAMENRPIPKDAVAAGRYIPVNNKLTDSQKRSRCKQCVIYNEHLKHQYKLMVPITIGGFALLYFVTRSPLLNVSGDLITRVNKILGSVTYGAGQIQQGGVVIFKEVILDCFMFVLLAYVLKLLEYIIFKLKV